VIGVPDGPQKIGVAQHLKYRLNELQTANGLQLVVAGSIEVERAQAVLVEHYAHYLLRASRLRGEWFDVSPDIAVEAIQEAARQVAAGNRMPLAPRAVRPSKERGNQASSKVTDALKNARVSAGMTQRELAAVLGITPQFVNDIEHGRRELGEQHYIKLPIGIRRAVVTADIEEMDERRKKLRRLLRLPLTNVD
jgi:DNA-binding XRE family transcriptional regulator